MRHQLTNYSSKTNPYSIKIKMDITSPHKFFVLPTNKVLNLNLKKYPYTSLTSVANDCVNLAS